MQTQSNHRTSKSMARRSKQTLYPVARGLRLLCLATSVLALSGVTAAQESTQPVKQPQIDTRTLGSQLQVGDVVFIHVPALPFKKIASATNSWTNHVGVVIDTSGQEPLIGESKIPLSTATPLSRFVGRSEHGRIRVSRLANPLTPAEQQAVTASARKRMGVRYDTGFNLNSRGQFCSRYVREVLIEATGQELGEIENFSNLLARNPAVDLAFWKLWYFGNIPWQRITVSPASLMESARLSILFDGSAEAR